MRGVPIPTISTARLTLRAQTIDDFAAYFDFLASPRAAGVGGPFDEHGAWGMFCHDAAQWQFFGHGALMIDLADTGLCVGQVGINHGPLFPEKELGWLIYDGHEGMGYASEAAAGMRDWAFGTLGLASLVSYIAPGNMRSIAVAERIGGVRDPAARGGDPTDSVYRHIPPPE